MAGSPQRPIQEKGTSRLLTIPAALVLPSMPGCHAQVLPLTDLHLCRTWSCRCMTASALTAPPRGQPAVRPPSQSGLDVACSGRHRTPPRLPTIAERTSGPGRPPCIRGWWQAVPGRPQAHSAPRRLKQGPAAPAALPASVYLAWLSLGPPTACTGACMRPRAQPGSPRPQSQGPAAVL